MIGICKSCFIRGTVKRIQNQAMGWKKIFANHISDKDLYTEYTNNSQNSAIEKQATQFSKCPKFWTHTSPKKIHEWLTGTWNDAQQTQPWTSKLKPPWDATTYQLKRLEFISLPDNSKCWWGCTVAESLKYCWQRCKMVDPLWKTID